MKRRRLLQAFVVLMVTVCLLTWSGLVSAQGNSDNAFQRVRRVQERHTEELMAKEGVVGTAVGLGGSTQLAMLVLLEKEGMEGIPGEFEGVSVQPLVTGKIEALAKPGNTRLSPTSIWPLPVPIGVSTGNAGQCSAGTISCRVTDGINVYALSNNHVYALENTAPIGSQILQPGLYDTRCVFKQNNLIGTLDAFIPISFTTNDTVDCAIAATTKAALGTATPSNGYGTPNSTTAAAALSMAVQKYGRTTSLTTGTITGLNATVTVSYSTGTATFVGQIIVTSPTAFIKAGDSGSLLVTNDTNCYPVGLLFAGNNNGTYAVANQIDLVLSAFGVSIDGK